MAQEYFEILFRLVAALAAGGLIGLERSHRGRPAAIGILTEYRMVLRSMGRESARALSDALRANRAVLEYRIAPTTD